MGTNEKIRRKFQAGTEVTRGTAVPATRIIYADVNPSFDRPITEFPDRSGTYFARRRVAYGRPTIGFSGTDLLTYEDFPMWLELGVKGGVTATPDAGTGGVPGQTRVYTPSAATDDLKSWTLEFNEPGNPYESTQFMLNSFVIRVDPDNEGGWMLDFEAFARDWTPTTFTPALTDRTTEVIRAPGTLAFLDTTTIGSTPLTGKVIDFSLTCNLNLHMKAFMEDDQSWAANKVGRDARTFDAVVTMEFDSDVEFANYRAVTAVQRKLRIQRTGSTLNSVPASKKAQIDLYGYWRSIGFGDRQGNLTATFGMQGFYDVTAGYDASFTSVNGLITLP